MTDVRPLTSDDDIHAAAILARAFRDDPIMNWLSTAPDFLPLLFNLSVPAYRAQGISYLGAGGEGVALWMGPGKKAQWPSGWAVLVKFVSIAGWRALCRLTLLGNKVERAHPVTPHYYLFAIGIEPDMAGQGVGSKLIEHMLARCDREGQSVYLENSNPRNLPFYRKHGFRVLREVRPTRTSPTLWLMWREPQGSMSPVIPKLARRG